MPEFRQLIRFEDLICQSDEFNDKLQLARRIAQTSLSVFIWSEEGAGAYPYAKLVHDLSDRANQPFISVTVSDNRSEDQDLLFFGRGIGANRYAGQLELANGGTLFIEHIERLHPNIQNRLFRVLHQREMEINANDLMKMDVRVMASSRFSAQELSQKPDFRADLLYRLDGIPVSLPPLRNRGADILRTAEIFIKRLCFFYQMEPKSFDTSAIKILFSYAWPGNYRELFRVLEKAVFLCNDPLVSADHLVNPKSGKPLLKQDSQPAEAFYLSNDKIITWEEAKLILFKKALKIADHDVEKAAELIGISRATAFRMMKKYETELQNPI